MNQFIMAARRPRPGAKSVEGVKARCKSAGVKAVKAEAQAGVHDWRGGGRRARCVDLIFNLHHKSDGGEEGPARLWRWRAPGGGRAHAGVVAATGEAVVGALGGGDKAQQGARRGRGAVALGGTGCTLAAGRCGQGARRRRGGGGKAPIEGA